MPIWDSSNLKFMDRTAYELCIKHQLNAANNGVTAIDECLSYSPESGIFIARIMFVRFNGNSKSCSVQLKRGDDIITTMLPVDTKIMNDNNTYISISDGTLRPTANVLVVNANDLHDFSCSSYAVLSIGSPTYVPTVEIRSDRHNYVTSQGLVLASD